jgi:hypothetical protein
VPPGAPEPRHVVHRAETLPSIRAHRPVSPFRQRALPRRGSSVIAAGRKSPSSRQHPAEMTLKAARTGGCR